MVCKHKHSHENFFPISRKLYYKLERFLFKILLNVAIEAMGAYPMDLIKSRMQIQRPGALLEEPLYRGSWDCFKKILRTEGVTGELRINFVERDDFE